MMGYVEPRTMPIEMCQFPSSFPQHTFRFISSLLYSFPQDKRPLGVQVRVHDRINDFVWVHRQIPSLLYKYFVYIYIFLSRYVCVRRISNDRKNTQSFHFVRFVLSCFCPFFSLRLCVNDAYIVPRDEDVPRISYKTVWWP